MLKISSNIFRFILFGLYLSLIQACGVPGPGGGSSSSDNGDKDVFTPQEIIGLRIETNDEMLASWHDNLFDFLTPPKAYALEGLTERNDISLNRISIVALNYNFQEFLDGGIPDYEVRRNLSGGYELQFTADYIEQVNYVIKVELPNGEVLYAALFTLNSTNDSNTVPTKPNNESIVVNAGSHYVLKKLFDTIESEAQLDSLLPCSANENNCPNQFIAKAALLEQISLLAQDYEIDIPASANIDDALALFDQNLDFRTHIESAVAEITREVSPFSKGTPRSFTISDGTTLGRLYYDVEYNGLRFAMSMNNLNPDNTLNEVLIGTETSRIVNINELDNDLPAYPRYNQTSTLLDMRRELLSSDIPFTRTALSIGQVNNYNLDNSGTINSFSSFIGDSFLSTEGNVLDQRVIQQTLPEPQNTGWQFNPLFSKLYHANEYVPDTSGDTSTAPEETPDYGASPTWLIGAYYSTGGSYEVIENGGAFTRTQQLEDINLFSWEVHGQETDDTFNINQLNDKKYGVINYSLKLDDSSNTLALFAETEQWDVVSSGAINVLQPSAHYRSHTLTRNTSNVVTEVDINGVDTISAQSHAISTVKTEEASGNSSIVENQGLVRLDGGPFAPTGHSSQNGKSLAFVFEQGLGRNDSKRGRGITVATELRSTVTTPNFTADGDRYGLLGNSFGMYNADSTTENKNTLRNVSNSFLTLSNPMSGDAGNVDCRATLEVNAIFIEHLTGMQAGENTLSEPLKTQLTPVSSTACSLSGSEIKLDFDDVFGQALTLKGFISQAGLGADADASGNVITLLWIQHNNLGLVFANKDQKLSPVFE